MQQSQEVSEFSAAAVIDSARPTPGAPLYRRFATAIVALAPLVCAVWVIVHGVGSSIPWLDIGLAAVFAVVVGHGVTIGYHRLFTHHSFEAKRPLKIVLAALGSMSFQGSLIGWVADHRRHHRFSDRPNDPHSPYQRGSEHLGLSRGLWHAHLGWCFTNEATSREAFAADLLADPDLVMIDRLFIVFCAATLLLPFGIGYAISGTLAGALGAFVWAGILRIGYTHHVTWAINSICHRFGTQPFRSHDGSRNVAALAIVSMGESWHNAHHAFPRSARHGLGRRQLDSSAAIIRLFERLHWVSAVQWPRPDQILARSAAA